MYSVRFIRRMQHGKDCGQYIDRITGYDGQQTPHPVGHAISVCSDSEIERDPNVREQLVYYPNDSLYEIGGKYRYVEYRYKKSQRQHTVASLEIDEALATLLNTAADGQQSNNWCKHSSMTR